MAEKSSLPSVNDRKNEEAVSDGTSCGNSANLPEQRGARLEDQQPCGLSEDKELSTQVE